MNYRVPSKRLDHDNLDAHCAGCGTAKRWKQPLTFYQRLISIFKRIEPEVVEIPFSPKGFCSSCIDLKMFLYPTPNELEMMARASPRGVSRVIIGKRI